MAQLVDIFGFISVLLRGLTLSFEALVVGGIVFLMTIAPSERGRRLLLWFAALLAATAAANVALTAAILAGTLDLAWTSLLDAGFCIAGALIVLGSACVLLSASRRVRLPGCLAGGALLVAGSVLNSHSFARLHDRSMALTFTAVHHLAGAAWVGGLLYLLLALRETSTPEIQRRIVDRFSRLAMVSVAVLIAAGASLGWMYVGSAAALEGTTYGAMLLSKVFLTALLLLLGGLNLRVVQAVRRREDPALFHLRRFGEVELGIGLTVLLAAASLTSTAPAIDVRQDLVHIPDTVRRMTPRWPDMHTPAFSELAPATPLGKTTFSGLRSFLPGQVYNPTAPADIKWSEYNHHWAGLVVLAMGLLSLAARRWRWARIWPLAFLGLAVFLLVRADSDNWPLGPRGFWESFQVAEVAQHRLFVALIVLFAIFEWAVEVGRINREWARLVFPAVCAVGGALLLTHSHSVSNVREEYFQELSHIPLAILGVIAGWSRWLEIRLPERRRVVTWIWPACFILVGVILVGYRER